MRRSPSISLVLVLSAAALSGCATAGAMGSASLGAMTGEHRTFGEGFDDSRAESRVRERLSAADPSGFAGVDADVADGRLLLSGFAPTQQHRDTAELIASNVSGIREIFDEIQIGPTPRLTRNIGDDLITSRVRADLVASPRVHGVDVSIQTHRGVVYLMGAMGSREEIQHAAEIASGVSGVTRVVSLMTERADHPRIQRVQQTASAAPN